MNRERYKINQIKNISFIYLYEIPYSAIDSGKYYGLKIIMESNEVLDYTYKDPLFKEFCKKVHATYHLETKQGSIISVLGELTQEFLKNKEVIADEHVIELPDTIETADEKYSLEDGFENSMLSPYIFRFLNTYASFREKKQIEVQYALRSGYKARRHIAYTEDNVEKQMPARITRTEDNRYEIYIYMVKYDETVKLHFKMLPDQIQISFYILDTPLHGNIEYTIEYPNEVTHLCENVSIMEEDSLLYTNTNNLQSVEASSEEEEYVLGFLKKSDLAIDRDTIEIHKVSEGIFYVDDLMMKKGTLAEQVITDINAMFVVGDCIAVKYTVCKFVYDSQTCIKQVLDTADIDIVFKKLRGQDSQGDYIVCQKYFNSVKTGNADYKNKMIGRYSDDVFQVENGYSLLQGAEDMVRIDQFRDYPRQKYKVL